MKITPFLLSFFNEKLYIAKQHIQEGTMKRVTGRILSGLGKLRLFLIIIFVFLMALDVLLTYWGLSYGATELNPLLVYASANTNFVILTVLKIIAITVIIFLSTLFKNDNQSGFSFAFLNFIMFFVVLNNFVQLKSHGVI